LGGSSSPLGDHDLLAYLVCDGDRDRNTHGDVHGFTREYFNRDENDFRHAQHPHPDSDPHCDRDRDGDDFRYTQHSHPDSDPYNFDDPDCDRDRDLHGDGDVDDHLDLDARDRVFSSGT
jgi:hypothetical protein